MYTGLCREQRGHNRAHPLHLRALGKTPPPNPSHGGKAQEGLGEYIYPSFDDFNSFLKTLLLMKYYKMKLSFIKFNGKNYSVFYPMPKHNYSQKKT